LGLINNRLIVLFIAVKKFMGVIMQLGRTTLSKFVIEQLRNTPDQSDLGALLIDVAAAVKTISAMVAKGRWPDTMAPSTRPTSRARFRRNWTC
jgi:hypothetical protein